MTFEHFAHLYCHVLEDISKKGIAAVFENWANIPLSYRFLNKCNIFIIYLLLHNVCCCICIFVYY